MEPLPFAELVSVLPVWVPVQGWPELPLLSEAQQAGWAVVQARQAQAAQVESLPTGETVSASPVEVPGLGERELPLLSGAQRAGWAVVQARQE